MEGRSDLVRPCLARTDETCGYAGQITRAREGTHDGAIGPEGVGRRAATARGLREGRPTRQALGPRAARRGAAWGRSGVGGGLPPGRRRLAVRCTCGRGG